MFLKPPDRAMVTKSESHVACLLSVMRNERLNKGAAINAILVFTVWRCPETLWIQQPQASRWSAAIGSLLLTCAGLQCWTPPLSLQEQLDPLRWHQSGRQQNHTTANQWRTHHRFCIITWSPLATTTSESCHLCSKCWKQMNMNPN